MVIFKNVTKSYNNINNAVTNLNLEIKEGRVLGLIGHNGAGKTTTIKMMTGILKPTSGEILINGKNVFKNSVEVKKQIGFAVDNGYVPEVFTGLEYLNFVCDMYQISIEDREKRIKILSEKFAIEESLNDRLSSYSKGMKQKIVLIASVLHLPKVWILDEPLNGLDPESCFILKNFMKEYSLKGNTVIFSTHILEVAEKICDEIAIINKSNLIYNGTLDELKSKYPARDLEYIFLKITA